MSEYVAVEKRLLKEILQEIGELRKLVNECCPSFGKQELTNVSKGQKRTDV